EIRSRNFLQKGDRLPTGEALETEAALPHIPARAVEALGERSRPSAPSGRVGRGIACNMQPYGRTVWFRDRAQAWIGFEADGALVIRAGVTDLGGGQAASLAQLAAEVLGVSPDRIAVHIGDSALTPLAGGTFATRQLYMSGNAVVKAAGELRAMMIPVAASLLEAAEPDVQFAGNHAGVIGAPERTIALARVVKECARRGIPTSLLSGFQGEHAAPIDLETGQGRTFPDYTFGCHAVEVEVDAETGTVRVLKLAACHAVGRAINPQSVEGQIQGGAVMGAGQARVEEVADGAGRNPSTRRAGKSRRCSAWQGERCSTGWRSRISRPIRLSRASMASWSTRPGRKPWDFIPPGSGTTSSWGPGGRSPSWKRCRPWRRLRCAPAASGSG